MDETICATNYDDKSRRVRVKDRGISDREAKIKYLISCIAWPGLMVLCTATMAYVVLIVTLFFLERWMPHEREWTKPDGQTLASILHTLSSKGTTQLLLVFGGIIELTGLMEDPPRGIWPRDWPVAAQVVLALVGAEFPL
jgi:ornithine lipid hydroxylase